VPFLPGRAAAKGRACGVSPFAGRYVSDSLVVREIDSGNGLAREYMAAHQQCELLYPHAGDSKGRL